ncbi:amino acid ABC transporter substrate-binding protein [Burkholderia ubonensis]|uniref:amino acid ABC transporter substrate-binding protein n=1 Tax=Burkholderia ubonensis TaxID=101571 RepID=UPI00075F3636|nr:amino acid ABC transporter substrate-binding protein [Burkholderia ubonensis]KVH69311.1 amino acid ABC transporter substrate-binding protein [Burkholderia ubonensis]KVU01585.1 amino acid ABC transporter substrate-binding protein [Burkholderia ubonensis]KVU20192.1 amino acid ABC transporter substrate-binding protein [Burkholderia ubonensis]
MKLIRSMLLVALLPIVAAANAFAADDLSHIKSSGVFRVGTEGTYAPFTYHDETGRLTGFDVDLATAIAQRLGVKPQFVEGKWDGLIAGLDVNRYDAVVNEVAITDARKAKYDFSAPYITSRAVLIVRADNTTIRSFDDLKGRKSANTLTSNFGKLAAAHGADVVAVQGFNEAIDLLTSGRVDATVNDSLSYLDFRKHKPDAKLKIAATDTSGAGDQSGVLIRKGSPELRAAIDKALADIKADGTYAKVSQKYFGHDVSQQ